MFRELLHDIISQYMKNIMEIENMKSCNKKRLGTSSTSPGIQECHAHSSTDHSSSSVQSQSQRAEVLPLQRGRPCVTSHHSRSGLPKSTWNLLHSLSYTQLLASSNSVKCLLRAQSCPPQLTFHHNLILWRLCPWPQHICSLMLQFLTFTLSYPAPTCACFITTLHSEFHFPHLPWRNSIPAPPLCWPLHSAGPSSGLCMCPLLGQLQVVTSIT